MLLSNHVEIIVGRKNSNFLKRKYNITNDIKQGDIINIPIHKLTNGSKYKVKVSCDYCGKILNIEYKKHIKSTEYINKHSCSNKKCSNQKIKDVCNFKYGVDNPFQLESVKLKSKKTNLEKYGVEHPMYSEEIKDKLKETNLERYGVDSFTKTDKYLEKTKKTNLERYGVEWSLQSDNIKEKSKISNLKKYGVEYPSQSKEFRDKVIETSVNKWGYKCNLQSEEVKEKIKQTNIEKYGTDNVMKSEEIRKKYYNISKDKNYIKYLENGISLFKCDCGENHNFEISSDNYISRKNNNLPLCLICYPLENKQSILERELIDYIRDNYNGKIISGYRDGLEIDIFLPVLNIGFEFNGLYWHSELYRDKNYHLYKTNYFKEKGIRIIHIWEDEWLYKTNIIKSQIKNWLGMSNVIYARKCEVKIVSNKESKEFLNNNHIQGNDRSSLNIGLYYENELVSLMTFDHFEGRKKMSETEWNLSRFSNLLNTSVIGGASKLLKYFIKNYNPYRIVSYADRSWSEGNLYEKLGFDKINETKPDYKYIVNRERKHKSNYRKSKTNISESNLSLLKIYDCGKIKYEYTIKKES